MRVRVRARHVHYQAPYRHAPDLHLYLHLYSQLISQEEIFSNHRYLILTRTLTCTVSSTLAPDVTPDPTRDLTLTWQEIFSTMQHFVPLLLTDRRVLVASPDVRSSCTLTPAPSPSPSPLPSRSPSPLPLTHHPHRWTCPRRPPRSTAHAAPLYPTLTPIPSPIPRHP